MPPATGLDLAPAARLGRRLASLFYELILALGILAVGFLLPHAVLGMSGGIALPGLFLLAHVFLLLGAYFVWCWRHGQTLAMQTWKIRLTGTGGNPPTISRLVLRYLLAWPSVGLGFGLLWALFDGDRQFLHDRLAGTRLVSGPP